MMSASYGKEFRWEIGSILALAVKGEHPGAVSSTLQGSQVVTRSLRKIHIQTEGQTLCFPVAFTAFLDTCPVSFDSHPAQGLIYSLLSLFGQKQPQSVTLLRSSNKPTPFYTPSQP
ncbi:histone acetyltransferase mst2 [Moniliophthora roreri]|nr:histone acetyltransferase mst2 [Moniliophthora roreri]